MKARRGRGKADGQGQTMGPGRGRPLGRNQDRKLRRRWREWPPERGDAETRATRWLRLLDTEVLSVDIRRSWRYLYPDADRE